jgi:hypothetical protein
MRLRRFIVGMAFLASFVLVAGCGPTEEPVAKVHGKIVKGGAAYDPTSDLKGVQLPPEYPGVEIHFTRTDKPGQFQATYTKSGSTFELLGNNGNGIPLGKYTVKVYVGVPGAAAASPVPAAEKNLPPEYRKDKGQGGSAFSGGKEMASQDVEVKSGGNDITIEIGKK